MPRVAVGSGGGRTGPRAAGRAGRGRSHTAGYAVSIAIGPLSGAGRHARSGRAAGTVACDRQVGGVRRLSSDQSRDFTFADTCAMSARPASFGLSAPITLPMSAGSAPPAARAAASASSIAASISASESACGRNV